MTTEDAIRIARGMTISKLEALAVALLTERDALKARERALREAAMAYLSEYDSPVPDPTMRWRLRDALRAALQPAEGGEK